MSRRTDIRRVPSKARWLTFWIQANHLRWAFSETDEQCTELEEFLTLHQNIYCYTVMVDHLRRPAFTEEDFE